jgi:hypothetical protein
MEVSLVGKGNGCPVSRGLDHKTESVQGMFHWSPEKEVQHVLLGAAAFHKDAPDGLVIADHLNERLGCGSIPGGMVKGFGYRRNASIVAPALVVINEVP